MFEVSHFYFQCIDRNLCKPPLTSHHIVVLLNDNHQDTEGRLHVSVSFPDLLFFFFFQLHVIHSLSTDCFVSWEDGGYSCNVGLLLVSNTEESPLFLQINSGFTVDTTMRVQTHCSKYARTHTV